MKNLAYLLIGVLILSSCDEHENPIYDNVNGSTLIGFNRSTIDVPVDIDTDNFSRPLEVTVSVSTISDVERSYTVSVDEDESSVDASNYQLPASVTIPANSYNGTFTVGFQDATLETTSELLVLELDGADAAFDTPVTLNVFQVCPIPSDYMIGDYEISDNETVFNNTNFTTRVVNIQEGDSATSRQFVTDWSGGPDFTVTLNLVCNELIYASTNPTGYVAGTPQGPIVIVPADENDSTYDLADDSFFIVEYDNQAGGFGTFEGSFFLFEL